MNHKLFAMIVAMLFIAVTSAGCLGGDDDSGPDDSQPKIEVSSGIVPPKSGWIASPVAVDSDTVEQEHTENFTTPGPVVSMSVTVRIEDSDAAHMETDDGSDPDTAKVTVSDGGNGSMSQSISTSTGTYTFEFGVAGGEEAAFCKNWVVEIKGVEFGGGKDAGGVGPFPGLIIGTTYYDQGLAWSIEAKYTYVASE
ncbi:MAG: hypothetical protein KAT70_09590 [Thermoplasmata archaeon]|nr:hypothetical protein [Thermoplasmata archaeon]